LKILHFTPDKTTKFWIERSKSKITNLKIKQDFVFFDIFSESKDGLLVKFYKRNKKIGALSFSFEIIKKLLIY